MSTLPPAPPDAKVLPVSELNRRVRELLEGSVPLLWVGGEISNFLRASSGHWYFSLKDAGAQVRCVMFRHKSQYVDWLPQDGMQVEARSLVTLYEQRGEFQLNVETLRRAGLGALYEKFERLKARLAAEGLFGEARKRLLPEFPQRIGIVTSPAGAALRDVLSTLLRRSPRTPVIIYPTPVQGEGAAAQIAQALRSAGERAECDVLILCRGGGSIEDLWQFNEEVVARAIAACPIPIVCGVGHETDFTIADFVADERAPTPTAAAELVAPDSAELARQLRVVRLQLQRMLANGLEARMQGLDHLARRLVHPGVWLQRQATHLHELGDRLGRARHARWQAQQWQIDALRLRLDAVKLDLRERWDRQQAYARRLGLCMTRALEKSQSRVAALQSHLIHLNPEAVLDRGYSIVIKEDGSIVRAAEQLAIDETVTMRFAEGEAKGRVVDK